MDCEAVAQRPGFAGRFWRRSVGLDFCRRSRNPHCSGMPVALHRWGGQLSALDNPVCIAAPAAWISADARRLCGAIAALVAAGRRCGSRALARPFCPGSVGALGSAGASGRAVSLDAGRPLSLFRLRRPRQQPTGSVAAAAGPQRRAYAVESSPWPEFARPVARPASGYYQRDPALAAVVGIDLCHLAVAGASHRRDDRLSGFR